MGFSMMDHKKLLQSKCFRCEGMPKFFVTPKFFGFLRSQEQKGSKKMCRDHQILFTQKKVAYQQKYDPPN